MEHIRKILITGASGFIGSRAANALKDAYELITPSHRELDLISATSASRCRKLIKLLTERSYSKTPSQDLQPLRVCRSFAD